MSAALRAYAQREAESRSEQNREAAQAAAEAGAEEQAPYVGKRVQISGLLARPELNGQVGLVTSFSAANARYVVSVAGESIALKVANLTVAKSNSGDSDAFSEGSRVRLKGLSAKPELNGCGGTVVEWNDEKERFVVELAGSMQRMLFRAANLERDRREQWSPEMHTAANLAHIQAETDRYLREQAANSNPLAQMLGGQENADAVMKHQEERKAMLAAQED